MNNNDVCQTLALWEGLKNEVNIADIKEIYKKLCMMCYLQPEIVALMIKHGKKSVENM